jgi:hypothetical protein
MIISVVKKLLLMPPLMLIVWSCTQTTSSVGTILNNPSLPNISSQKLVPDFGEYIPEESLGATSVASALTLPGAAHASSDELDGPAADWTEVFLEGGVNDARALRENIEAFGEAGLSAMTTAGVTDATVEFQTAMLGTFRIIDTTAEWVLEYNEEENQDTDEEYVRMFFKNIDDDPEGLSEPIGKIQATYVFRVENDLPVKGIFAYVNPLLLSETASGGIRMVAAAFDFTDASRNLLMLRVDADADGDGIYVKYHVHSQCDLSTQNCSGQYVEIATPEPESSFTQTLRYDWSDQDNEVCIAEATFGESVTLGTAQGFEGPAQPEANQISECSLSETADWIPYSYDASYLPERYKDSDPVGGQALTYYANGSSKDGWYLVAPNQIVQWLRASGGF